MGPAAASALPLRTADPHVRPPPSVEVRPNTSIDQAQGREPGQMFALPQPNRRQLTWYSGGGREGPLPLTPAIEHSDKRTQRT